MSSILTHCSPDRLPLYEKVFKETVAKQSPRFDEMYCSMERDEETGEARLQQLGNLTCNGIEVTPRQRKLLREMASISRTSDMDHPVSLLNSLSLRELHVALTLPIRVVVLTPPL